MPLPSSRRQVKLYSPPVCISIAVKECHKGIWRERCLFFKVTPTVLRLRSRTKCTGFQRHAQKLPHSEWPSQLYSHFLASDFSIPSRSSDTTKEHKIALQFGRMHVQKRTQQALDKFLLRAACLGPASDKADVAVVVGLGVHKVRGLGCQQARLVVVGWVAPLGS